MASIIKGHNQKVLNNEKASSAGCNCRNKNNCPLDKQCLTTATIYQAKVFEPEKDNDPKVYVGMAESEFKTRFYNHTLSFKNKDYAKKPSAIEIHLGPEENEKGL